jgi:hypothetical protein
MINTNMKINLTLLVISLLIAISVISNPVFSEQNCLPTISDEFRYIVEENGNAQEIFVETVTNSAKGICIVEVNPIFIDDKSISNVEFYDSANSNPEILIEKLDRNQTRISIEKMSIVVSEWYYYVVKSNIGSFATDLIIQNRTLKSIFIPLRADTVDVNETVVKIIIKKYPYLQDVKIETMTPEPDKIYEDASSKTFVWQYTNQQNQRKLTFIVLSYSYEYNVVNILTIVGAVPVIFSLIRWGIRKYGEHTDTKPAAQGTASPGPEKKGELGTE